jgi:hypothetical protein
MAAMNEQYAPIFLDGGGDPNLGQIDAYLRAHFNASVVQPADAPRKWLTPEDIENLRDACMARVEQLNGFRGQSALPLDVHVLLKERTDSLFKTWEKLPDTGGGL